MAVHRIADALPKVSQRRACQIVGQPRSTHRYVGRQVDKDKRLVSRLHELARAHPRYGYRFMTTLIRRDDEFRRVNVKRVYRLWRAEGLKVPRKQVKKRRLGTSENGIVAHRSEFKDHVWCYDFVKDQTLDGRPLKFLPIVDEFTRECLALETARHITAHDVIETLKYLFEVRGAPRFIRSDNGPEFVARAVKAFLAASNVETLFIEPGSPWENAYIESFNSRFRDEFLNRELFTGLAEAQVITEDHRLDYNDHRPHSSLGYVTPAAFAASLSQPPVGAWPLPTPASAMIDTESTLTGVGT